MNLGELIERARVEILFDIRSEKYLWSDDEITAVYNDAVLEAAERACLIYDDITVGVCQVPLTAAVSNYQLHPAVIYLDEIYLVSNDAPIEELSLAEMVRRFGASWRSDKGVPKALTRRFSRFSIYPQPEVNDALRLCVTRRPLDTEKLVIDSDIPAIPSQYHFDLMYWIGYRMFSKPDTEVFDVNRAERYLGRFVDRFGERKSAQYDQVAQQMGRQENRVAPRFV